MRYLFSALMVLSLAGACMAGTVTKCSFTHNLKVNDTFTSNTNITNTSVRLLLVNVIEANLTPGETAAFGPDTLFEGTFPLGPTGGFRLSEDPDYTPGKTSARISSSQVVNGVTWKRVITLRWDGNLLKMRSQISTNQAFSKSAPIAYQNVPKNKVSRTYATETLVSLIATNAGTEVMNLQAQAATTIKTQNSGESKRTGQTKIWSTQLIRGKLALPLI